MLHSNRLVLLTAAPAQTSVDSARMDADRFTSVGVNVSWTGLTGVINATAKLQESNDGASWVDVPGATINLAGAAGADMIRPTGLVTGSALQLVYAAGGVTGGTVSAVACLKG